MHQNHKLRLGLPEKKLGSKSLTDTLLKVLFAPRVSCRQILWASDSRSGIGHRKGALLYGETSKRIIPSIP